MPVTAVLMPRGAGFCHVFGGAFTVRLAALSTSSQSRPEPARLPSRGRVPSPGQVIETALVHTELSPRELACRITDREGEFLSESSVSRIESLLPLVQKVGEAAFAGLGPSSKALHGACESREGGRDSGLLWEDVESAAKNVAKASVLSPLFFLAALLPSDS